MKNIQEASRSKTQWFVWSDPVWLHSLRLYNKNVLCMSHTLCNQFFIHPAVLKMCLQVCVSVMTPWVTADQEVFIFASHSLFSCNWSMCAGVHPVNRDGVSCQCGGVNLLHSHFQTVFVFCTCCCLMFELTLVFYLFLTLNLSFYDICSVLLNQMYHSNSSSGVFWDSRLGRGAPHAWVHGALQETTDWATDKGV